MKNRLNRLWKSGRETVASQSERALEHTCAGRVVNALTFIVILVFLALWITAFLVLKDQLFTQTLFGNVFTNLTCILFFGGLVLALFAGALAGNFIRRAFWKLLARRSTKNRI